MCGLYQHGASAHRVRSAKRWIHGHGSLPTQLGKLGIGSVHTRPSFPALHSTLLSPLFAPRCFFPAPLIYSVTRNGVSVAPETAGDWVPPELLACRNPCRGAPCTPYCRVGNVREGQPRPSQKTRFIDLTDKFIQHRQSSLPKSQHADCTDRQIFSYSSLPKI